MILYNVTYRVEHEAHAAWLQFMQRDYTPILMESGHFEDFKLSRLLGVDESEGITYALQLTCASRPTFEIYQQNLAREHQRLHDAKWGAQFVVFRSVLDVVARG